jgi:hypothetical protein
MLYALLFIGCLDIRFRRFVCKEFAKKAAQRCQFFSAEAGEIAITHNHVNFGELARQFLARPCQAQADDTAVIVPAHAEKQSAFFQAIDHPRHRRGIDIQFARQIGCGFIFAGRKHQQDAALRMRNSAFDQGHIQRLRQLGPSAGKQVTNAVFDSIWLRREYFRLLGHNICPCSHCLSRYFTPGNIFSLRASRPAGVERYRFGDNAGATNTPT